MEREGCEGESSRELRGDGEGKSQGSCEGEIEVEGSGEDGDCDAESAHQFESAESGKMLNARERRRMGNVQRAKVTSNGGPSHASAPRLHSM